MAKTGGLLIAQLNEFYVKINEGKKDKVSIHKYFTAKDFRKDQKPDDYGFLKDLVLKEIIMN